MKKCIELVINKNLLHEGGFFFVKILIAEFGGT